ncbi:MAG TPA: sigma-70 family RNA polymerase sigma factor [Candidatus Limnocylindrales bacterium]|nr:sigma-70 family RNA polymerase sigma factor [Candidatus Limnocylindrales bacterium]
MQRDLVERAANGEQEAFDALARLVSGRLFAIAYRILRDHYLAEDALQGALITIWNELPRLRDPDRFDAWTYRLIVRASVAEARRERRGGPAIQLLPDDADVSAAPDQFRAVADRDQLERGFRRLTPEQRAILVLQHFAGLSLAEIADVLGIPVGTAGSRIHYAARALRAAIEADSRSVAAEGRMA